MEPPDHCQPSNTNANPALASISQEPSQVPTISSLDHVLLTTKIEEILEIELGTQPNAVIKTMENFNAASNILHLDDTHASERNPQTPRPRNEV